MNCREFTEWIALRLDGSLPEPEARAVEEHMSTCSRCRTEAFLQERIHEALAEELPSRLAADFTERVSASILQVTEKRRATKWPLFLPAFLLAAGACALILWGGSLLSHLTAPLTTALSGPLDWLSTALDGFFNGLGKLPASLTPARDGPSGIVANILVATMAGLIPVIWAFRRVLVFLRG